MSEQPYRVWDLPVRLFHWSLVILITISIYTGENGGFNEMDYHMLSGYAVLALILFRIFWGFLGSRHARFSDFFKPTEIAAYTSALFSREKDEPKPGHNPLGGLSVVAILLVLLIQASTGLFANDDIFLEGPLTHLVEDEMSDDLTTVHYYASRILYALIFLHLAAILYHQFIRKDRLLLPMITGKRKVNGALHDDARPTKEMAIAALVMAVCAALVFYLINEV
ncbi:MAG: cytochrome b/b6 domain-containing protein [Pseudomonadales bacterium]|nr:cytochrome b/b6 domain-containing protein [Pseudomonadales bacterium]MBO6658051.1 cytochrome b/b6 domain-containing protein [Pseudomonadales bacterium]MBO6703084.1 cytochrome b/b6 domain-containing protein [Pseudomonadales bacterium]MBO7007934.1 cytochrome b/b6 domain-containing protein [Pseudomonadales bacterium]